MLFPATIRLWLLLSSTILLGNCQFARSPEEETLRQLRLVDLSDHEPRWLVSLQYQKAQPLAKRPLYHPEFPALLHQGTAKRLRKANALLRKKGLRLVIWDAYRPHETQLALWDASGHDDTFVANPFHAPSLHTHACAVDVSLAHLDGRPAAVPTDFDDFSPRAASDYPHPDPVVRKNMRLLKEAMWAAGFGTLPHEWWHFMDKDYREIPCIATESLPESLQSMISSTR